MGFADPHMRSKDQVQYDANYNEMYHESLNENPAFSTREHHRWLTRKLGKRPNGGRGLNS